MSVQLFIRDIQFMSQVEMTIDTQLDLTQCDNTNIPVSWSLCPWVAQASSSWEKGEGWKSWEQLCKLCPIANNKFSSFQDLLNPGEPEKILEISEFSMLRCAKHFYVLINENESIVTMMPQKSHVMYAENSVYLTLMSKTLLPCQTKGHWKAKEIIQVGNQKRLQPKIYQWQYI